MKNHTKIGDTIRICFDHLRDRPAVLCETLHRVRGLSTDVRGVTKVVVNVNRLGKPACLMSFRAWVNVRSLSL